MLYGLILVVSTTLLASQAHAVEDAPYTLCQDSLCCSHYWTNCTYQEFAMQMGVYGYDWDAHTTTTDDPDGFTLTLFHITGKN